MIAEFSGHHRFLSNFELAPVLWDGKIYPTVEHAYQAAKTLDHALREIIRKAASPGKAKRMARNISPRKDWDDIKLCVMLGLLRQKFSYADLASMLLETENQELVEGNTWGDIFWGVYEGHGENNLGKLLMQVREEIGGTTPTRGGTS